MNYTIQNIEFSNSQCFKFWNSQIQPFNISKFQKSQTSEFPKLQTSESVEFQNGIITKVKIQRFASSFIDLLIDELFAYLL